MANSKISALTASTTPLAGTEVLPIVQSSTTKQVSVANLTAGRTVSVASVTITGGISGPGIISKDATTGLQIRGIAGSGYDLELTNSGGATSMTVATGGYKTKFWDDVSTLGNVVISTSGKGIDFSATPNTGTSELLADYEEGTYTPTWNGGAITTIISAYYTKIGRQVTVIVDVILGASASAAVSEITVPFTALSASNWGSGGVAYTTYGATLFVSFDATTSKINFRATANTASLACAGVATSRFAFTLTYFS